MPGELRRVAATILPAEGTAIAGEAKAPSAPPSDVSGARSWINGMTWGFCRATVRPATVEAPIAVFSGGAATST